MIRQEVWEQALRSPQPSRELAAAAERLAAGGSAKGEIYDSLEQFVLHLREQGGAQETDEEIVLEVMDKLAGWCHPDARLLPGNDSIVG